MQKKKDKFLEKIVKKNYNNELEEILETKSFEENVKNLLLSILYKIEASYKDYEKVKHNVESKEDYINNFIEIIKNECNEIKVISPNSEESKILENKTFLVNKTSKKIICYPIERKLLYSIAKIGRNEKIIKDKYFLIDKTLSELINTGYNINMVEPLRDFNGYSWTTLQKEIESLSHNIIYQNLKILLGHKFLNNWVKNKEFIIDYMELFKNELELNYGRKKQREIVQEVSELSILLAMKFNKNLKLEIQPIKEEVESNLIMIENKEEFIEKTTKYKKEITKEIRRIDTIINNKELLKEEYIRRNEQLPLEKKIFSMRILSEIMMKEREKYFEKIDELNKIINPQNFIKYKQELEEKSRYLKLLDVEDLEKEINDSIIKLQKIFLDCLNIKINRAETKQEIITLIYELRYYCLIPFDQNRSINQVQQLKKSIEKVTKNIIKKAHNFKMINSFTNIEELEINILKNIFNIRIISLEDLYIKITKEKDKFYITLFDEDVFEEKVELEMVDILNKRELEIKLNKKIKLFT